MSRLIYVVVDSRTHRVLLAHPALLVVSHARIKKQISPRNSRPLVCNISRLSALENAGLFGHTLVGVEAVTKVLAVLVGGVVGEHLAAGGALKGLEAGLALDRLCGRVLVCCQKFGLKWSIATQSRQVAQRNTFTYGFQLALRLLGACISLTIPFLLRSIS